MAYSNVDDAKSKIAEIIALAGPSAGDKQVRQRIVYAIKYELTAADLVAKGWQPWTTAVAQR